MSTDRGKTRAKRRRLSRRLLIRLAVGVGIGILAVPAQFWLLWWALPAPDAKDLFLLLNRPALRAVDWYADIVYNGSTDQAVREVYAALVLYWVIIGLALELVLHLASQGAKRLGEILSGRRKFQFTLRRLLVFIASASVIFALTACVVRAVQRRSLEGPCKARLDMIATGLYQYHQAHGCLPPAYIPDKDGKPMHSWRVLILPFMGKQALYDRCDFREPWNGPQNRVLAKEMPREYRCPLHDGQDTQNTDFVVVVGPQTAWPGRGSVSFGEITDGWGTILLLEIANSDIHWMEPRDIGFDDAIAGKKRKGTCLAKRVHPQGIHCFVKGATPLTLPSDCGPELLKSMLTISGGEPVDVDELSEADTPWTPE